MPRGSKVGERRGGRQKGTPNKATAGLKDAIMAVFEEIGGGEAMALWARENQTQFYTVMVKAILPRPVEVGGQDGGPIEVVIRSAHASN